MNKIKSAVTFSFLNKYSSMIIQLLGSMILARLLTPHDFGVFALAFVCIALANVLKEFGVSQYLIKEAVLTDDKIRSAFTIMLLFSSLIAILLFFSATSIATFYDNPSLGTMIQLLSINILLSPFGSIVLTLLRRKMEFKPIFIAGTSSLIISYSLMIYLASTGTGATTLVYGAIIETVANIFIIQFFRPKNTPTLPGISEVKSVLRYSKYVIGSAISGQLGLYFSELSVGKFYPMESVGLLSRALSSADLFNRLFTKAFYPVVAPYISQLKREGNDTGNSIITLTEIQLSVAWPFFSALAILSEPFMLILFGKQWTDASIYLTIICISRIIFSSTQHFTPVFQGYGLAKEIMKLDLFSNAFKIIVIVISVQYGIETMLICLISESFIRSIFYVVLAQKHLSLNKKIYLRSLYKALPLTFATAIPLLFFQHYIKSPESINEYLLLMAAIISSAFIWLALIWNKKAGILIRSYLS